MTSFHKAAFGLLKKLFAPFRRKETTQHVSQIGMQKVPSDAYAIGQELDGARVVSCNLQFEIVGGNRVGEHIVTGLITASGAFIAHVEPRIS